MTRFMITLEQGVELVWLAFEDMQGGEIYVKKIPSMKVTDIAKTIAPNLDHEIVGIRPGEKLHEQMIGLEDAPFTYEYDNFYKILPAINNWSCDAPRIGSGTLVHRDFTYSSETNTNWMTRKELTQWIALNKRKIENL